MQSSVPILQHREEYSTARASLALTLSTDTASRSYTTNAIARCRSGSLGLSTFLMTITSSAPGCGQAFSHAWACMGSFKASILSPAHAPHLKPVPPARALSPWQILLLWPAVEGGQTRIKRFLALGRHIFHILRH